MNRSGLIERLGAIRRWKSGDQRAPHKPLLVLLALGRVQRGEPRLVPFAEIEDDLRQLLIEFGPQRRSYHPENPFWHLTTDGLWELDDEQLMGRSPSDSVPAGTLRSGVSGGFPPEVHDLLASDPTTLAIAIHTVLDEHFARSLHEDLLSAVGLQLELTTAPRQRRDPNFRVEVLRAYEYRCAMCGYDGQLGTVSLGVDAAHVRWWAHGGPDDLTNGLALCSLHHRVFDGGAVSVGFEGEILVSSQFRGTSATRQWVIGLHGRPLERPQAGIELPDENFVRWHRGEVFKGPPRLVELAAESPDVNDG